MSRIKVFLPDIVLLAGLLLLPLLLFSNVTLGSQTMIPADNLYQWQPWSSEPTVPHNGLISDLLLENYAWKQFIRQSVQAKELPLWNPYLFGGGPFLATGQNAAFYPFSLFFLLLPLTKAYGWYTVSQLWLAGVLAYWLGRVLGVSRLGSFVAGLVYQGCGFLVVSAAVFPMMIGAAAWLPLLLGCLEMVIRVSTTPAGAGKTLPWVALGSLALGCQILAGHIEITYYTLLVMAFFAAWRLTSRLGHQGASRPRSWLIQGGRPAGWLLALVLMGLMLGGIQFIPFYEVGQANFREGSASLEQVRGWAYPYRQVVAFALPNFFGNPAHHTYTDIFSGQTVAFTTNAAGESNPNGANSSDWGIKNYVEGGAYLGILPMLLALIGAWRGGGNSGRRSARLFFVVLVLLSLAFIFGTPLYALLYYGLPGLNQLHSPFRWVFPMSLGVALLAGFGLDEVAQGQRKPVLGYLAIGAGLLTLIGLLGSRLFYGRLEGVIEQVFRGLAKAPEAFANGRVFYSYLYPQVLTFGLLLLSSGLILWWSGQQNIGGFLRLADRFLFRIPAGRQLIWPLLQWSLKINYNLHLWQLLAVLVIGADLLLANWGFHGAADPALLTARPELVQWLTAQPGYWRLTTFAPHGDKTLNANTAWLYGLQDVRGYDSIIPKQYTDYMAVIEPQDELQFNRVQPVVNWQSLNSPLLDLLGVKYIVTLEKIELPKMRLAWQGGGVNVYENLAVTPRAFTLPQTATLVVVDELAAMSDNDPRQFVVAEQKVCDCGGVPAGLVAAAIDQYSNNQVTVRATVGEPSWLVLNDSYFPGWKAFVRPEGGPESSEQEIAIYRVNGNFRGVLLESGQWLVRFRYSPLSFKVGGLTSALAAIVLVFAFGVWGWRRFHNPQAPLTNTRSIAKNSLAPTALNLLNRGIDFLFAAFYLRVLGPAGNGSYATAIAIAGWFEIISNFGLNTLIIREVSRDKSQATHYLYNTTLLRFVTVGLGILPIVAYTAGIGLGRNPLDQQTLTAISLLMIGMIFSGVGQGFTGLFYAFEAAEIPAAIATVTTILKVSLGVVALVVGYTFVALAGVSIAVNIITLFMLTYVAFRKFRLSGPWRIDVGLQRQMLRQSYPLMINHLLATVFFFLDVPLMRQFNGEAAVGWYNSAYKWINAMNVIPSFFTFALFPVISRQVHHSLADARRTFRMAVKLMVLLSLPIAAFTTLLAPTLIGVLGGAEFLPHGSLALQLVIWSIPVGWVNSVTNYMLIALGQERVQVRAFLIGVGFNLLANLIFLPLFSYVAASVITILSEMVLLVVFNIYLRQKMADVGWFELIWRPAEITLIMLLVMAALGLAHPLLGVVAGMVIYPAGLWRLGAFGEDERHIWQAIVPAGLSGRLTRFRRP